MSPFLISQLIAGLALLVALSTFQFKRQGYVLAAFATMSALYSLHFVFLGQYTAAAIVAVSVVRFLTSIFTKRRVFMYIFLAATLVVGFLTYAAWYNLVAILAGCLGVIATFQPSDKRLRLTMMGSNLTMAVHDLIVQTPVGIAVDLTVFFSGVVGYYRYYLKGRQATAADTSPRG